MEANRGAPTPPIEFDVAPAAVSAHLKAPSIAVDATVLERLRRTGASVGVDESVLVESGRDWWPLAMSWALDGRVPARPACVVRPQTGAEVAAVLAVCNDSRVPVTPSAGRHDPCPRRCRARCCG